jgi:hypothetical protein
VSRSAPSPLPTQKSGRRSFRGHGFRIGGTAFQIPPSEDDCTDTDNRKDTNPHGSLAARKTLTR